jgi:hypothetical protein
MARRNATGDPARRSSGLAFRCQLQPGVPGGQVSAAASWHAQGTRTPDEWATLSRYVPLGRVLDAEGRAAADARVADSLQIVAAGERGTARRLNAAVMRRRVGAGAVAASALTILLFLLWRSFHATARPEPPPPPPASIGPQ